MALLNSVAVEAKNVPKGKPVGRKFNKIET